MILIQNADVFTPEYIGKKDVLLCGGKIETISDSINFGSLFPFCYVIDGTGKKLVPGIIDPHVHITGGGGEGSFHTQVPPLSLSELIKGGVTTVVGLLGTDGITRSAENLIAKAKSLKEEGLSVYACTGSYSYPSCTLTESVQKDILFIDEIIGVKLALSDHRAPNVSLEELIRLGSDVRVAGMLSGKCGMVTLHMGDDIRGLSLVREALQNTSIPAKTFHPTHVNRNRRLLEEAFDFARQGGYIDLTCGITGCDRPAACIAKASEREIPLDRITISSDGMGSWSTYDDAGNLLEIGYSSCDTLYKELQVLVREYGMPLEKALSFMTANTARSLEIFPKKGCIQTGSDADLLLLTEELDLDTVIANGEIFMENGRLIKKGTYEK
nr:beta-aspartyl-peptidase [uncultured Sellimonas sp.]